MVRVARAKARSAGGWQVDSAGTCSIAARCTAWWHWQALKAGLAIEDRPGHARLAKALDSQFGARPDGSELILLNGEDVTADLRSEAGGKGASRVAAWPEVRKALLARQHAFAAPPGLVADGRDMGTVVFPGAALKIYLVASPEERALRRYKQLKGKDSGVSLAALSRDIAERDRQDASRAVAPLVPAGDAVVIDSTRLSVAAVVDCAWRLGKQRALWN